MLSRRRLLGGIAAVGAVATVGGSGVVGSVAGALENDDHDDRDDILPSGSSLEAVSTADDLLDLQNADNGTWWKVTQETATARTTNWARSTK